MLGSAGVPRWSIEVIRTGVILALVLAIGTAYTAFGTSHDTETTYYACLYAGSLSQVGTTQPANCGRGELINWNTGGPTGASWLQQVSTGFVASDGSRRTQYVSCPDGSVPVGSGYVQLAVNTDHIIIRGSYAISRVTSNPYGFTEQGDAPLTSNYGWAFNYQSLGGDPIDVIFFVYCAEFDGPQA